jgi:hypothetical protein
MRSRRVAIALVLGALARASSIAAQAPGDTPSGASMAPVVQRDAEGHVTVRAVRAWEPIRIDGKLDERLYAESEAIGGYIQQEPDEGLPATERTESWVFFDEDSVYVSARCWETNPGRRVANEMRRDTGQLRQNDTFAVLFDTFHDRRNGYLFYANPIGGLADSQITDEGPPNVDWNTVWNVKTGSFAGGWTIEMAIPFKSLRYQPGRDQTWGINLRRVVRWKNEWSYLAPVPRALTTFRGILKVSSAATLVGLQAPPASRTIELKPYALGGLATDNTVTPRQINDGTTRAGADVKFGLTPNLTADLTINTDFAQVEVDEQQVNLTRFNLFFPEKRDFFLEGLGVFAFAGRASAGLAAGSGDTPYLFFSRRIGLDGGREMPLRAGGRLTGKIAGVTVGVLNVRTGDNDTTRPEESSTFTVIRGKRDILRRSSIGAMVTHRSATPGVIGANAGYGVDATFSFYQHLRVDTYLAGTRSDGRRGDNLSYRGFFDYNADRYGVQFDRLVVEPNFLPEIGFVRRTNMRRNFALGRFSPRPASIPRVRKLTMQGSINYITDNTNRLETRDLQAQFQAEFTNSDVAGVMWTDNFDSPARPFEVYPGIRIPIGSYDFRTLQLSYTAGQQRKASGQIVFESGPYYGGDRQSIALNTARLQITPQVSLEPSLAWNIVDIPQGSFTATVVRTRATYTLTPRMFVSGIAQYNSAVRSVGSNLRLRWEYLPGSELFVVYTDDYNSEAPRDLTALRNRALVVKINRLFRP